MILYRPSCAVSIYSGELGVENKAGFTPFRYDDFVEWAKKEGGRYRRLYKALPQKKERESTRQNRCGKLRLKSQCRCRIVVADSIHETEKVVFPAEEDIRLWEESEHLRQKTGRRSGRTPPPECPRSMGICLFYPPPKDLEALRVRRQNALVGGETWPVDAAKHKIVKTLTRKNIKNLGYVEDLDEQLGWLDDEDCQPASWLTDLETDVPLVSPDEPWTEYSPEEFLRLFGFEMEPDDESN